MLVQSPAAAPEARMTSSGTRCLRTSSELGPIIDVRPLIKKMGLADFLRQFDVKEVVDAIGVETLAKTLSPEQWDALLEHRRATQGGKGKRKRKKTTEE
jgi:hypothetical protein